MISSQPAILNSLAKSPPELASPYAFVSGDLPHTAKREPPGRLLPLRGPVTTKSGFLGDSGSTCGSTRSNISLAPNPLPPMNLRRIFLSSVPFELLPLLRSISSVLPSKPAISALLLAVSDCRQADQNYKCFTKRQSNVAADSRMSS